MNLPTLATDLSRELGSLGIKAEPGEIERDALRLNCDGFVIRGVIDRGRIRWQGFAPTCDILHYSERPMLNDSSTAVDAPVKRIAKQLAQKIVEPAREPLAIYAEKIAAMRARIAALPAAMESVRAFGFTVH